MGGSSHTETSTKVDPAQMALYQQNYNKANEIADQPFQPYSGEHIAPLGTEYLKGTQVAKVAT